MVGCERLLLYLLAIASGVAVDEIPTAQVVFQIQSPRVGSKMKIYCMARRSRACRGLEAVLRQSSGEISYVGCKVTGTIDLRWGVSKNGTMAKSTQPSLEHCSSMQNTCNQVTVMVELSSDMENSEIFCKLTDVHYLDQNIVSTSFRLRELQVPPENLTLTISENVTEGHEFTTNCTALPAHVAYAYEILRNGTLISNTSTYTPVKEDRCGVLVTCEDNVNAGWTKENTFASVDVYPWFELQKKGLLKFYSLGPIIEGRNPSFWCETEELSVQECSNYSYAVTRRVDGTLLSSVNSYTPVREDRGGIVITCSLTTKANSSLQRLYATIKFPGFQPNNLTLTMSENVMEGREFTTNCTAPPDNIAYAYEILRSGTLIANTSTYTPVKEDRCGIRVTCEDTVNAAWTKENTFASVNVYPWFDSQKKGLLKFHFLEPIFEGTNPNFWCEIEGLNIEECTNYSYVVKRRGDGTFLSSVNSYTPVKEDRGGIVITCSLTTRANSSLQRLYGVIKSPGYLDLKQATEVELTLDQQEENKIFIRLVSSHLLKYYWTYNNGSNSSTSSLPVLTLPARPEIDNGMENITCAILMNGIGEALANITWMVTWKTEVVTSTDSMETTEPIAPPTLSTNTVSMILPKTTASISPLTPTVSPSTPSTTSPPRKTLHPSTTTNPSTTTDSPKLTSRPHQQITKPFILQGPDIAEKQSDASDKRPIFIVILSAILTQVFLG